MDVRVHPSEEQTREPPRLPPRTGGYLCPVCEHGQADELAPYGVYQSASAVPVGACLPAYLRVPLLPGHWAWYQTFDLNTGDEIPRPDATAAVPALRTLLGQLHGLGWPLERIHLFGWQQGATVALELALSVKASPVDGASRLGSVASICGKFEREPSVAASQTPLFWFTRSPERSARTKADEEVVKKAFADTTIARGDGSGRLDMLGKNDFPAMFQFWGKVMARDDAWKGDGEVYEVVR